MLSPDTVVAVRPALRWRRVGEEAVLVIQDAGQVAGLNATGAAVLDAVDGRTTVGRLVELLAPRWEVPREQLAEDVRRILEELIGMGAIEVVTEEKTPSAPEKQP